MREPLLLCMVIVLSLLLSQMWQASAVYAIQKSNASDQAFNDAILRSLETHNAL